MQRPTLLETFEQMHRDRLPNLFRLYLNPFVAQTCFCLAEYVQTTWNGTAEHQSFLANSFDEALSGAIKLARYVSNVSDRSTTGLLYDPTHRLGPFVRTPVNEGHVEFLPGLQVASEANELQRAKTSPDDFGFVAVIETTGEELTQLRQWVEDTRALLVVCVSRESLTRLRKDRQSVEPDIVVFDESFVNGEVPFSAFTAKRSLYEHWNNPGKTTFHSTTFQPNTVSSLHFLRCLEHADPTFFEQIVDRLERIENDIGYRASLFRELYSPSLWKAMRVTDFLTADVEASGVFIDSEGRHIFDCVSGVACSVRGHNPSNYLDELQSLDGEEVQTDLVTRLREHTGLDHVVPAVSGASGVETALKLALTSQHPRRHVLALKAGFGGKTLFALTGTWNASYKQHIDPLYADVIYIDPFAADAVARVESAMRAHPIAVVQVELIQAVGGVRAVPEAVLDYLQTHREEHGYLLLVDEVQTGMFRTGPFSRARALGMTPDLLVLGKGTSDMMFPFALVQYSESVHQKLRQVGSNLSEVLQKRCDYPVGYRTVVNVLRFAEETHLAKRVTESGVLFEKLLRESLASSKAVREVRAFGLLIGIELNDTRWPQRWFRKKLFWFYLASMLKHSQYPLLVGFCQYEPNVLKITPPLTSDPEELHKVCSTIAEVLNRSFLRLFAAGVHGMIRSLWIGSPKQ